mmetsp:Transcript_34746/g.83078  ORF Transcript_34746/g.83078 Transcript_34746/m.83078 type:complete len:472 (+) Transcript_34746:198-1613(+)
MEERLEERLNQRRDEGSLRQLIEPVSAKPGRDLSPSPASLSHLIDFASNDYLGLARCKRQHDNVESAYTRYRQGCEGSPILGATGSRLLSGDSQLARSLETSLAKIHNRPDGLICNSGYDANLSVLSSLPYTREDTIIMDELVHNSLVMGIRMGRLAQDRVVLFKHNDVKDLERVLGQTSKGKEMHSNKSVIVVVESVYSMDGDVAPLAEILELAKGWRNASVIVDEAHGLGVYGRTNVQDLYDLGKKNDSSPLQSETRWSVKGGASVGGTGVLAALELEHHPSLLCSVHTFGKAAGCHGAVVVGSINFISYLVNYARPFVYSTSLPPHSLVTIQESYKSMTTEVGEERRRKVFDLVKQFRNEMTSIFLRLKRRFPLSKFELLDSPSPIQGVVTPGNARCIAISQYLRNEGRFDVYPIRSPTVSKGKERIRIILHSHNSLEEVRTLTSMLYRALVQSMMQPRESITAKARL